MLHQLPADREFSPPVVQSRASLVSTRRAATDPGSTSLSSILQTLADDPSVASHDQAFGHFRVSQGYLYTANPYAPSMERTMIDSRISLDLLASCTSRAGRSDGSISRLRGKDRSSQRCAVSHAGHEFSSALHAGVARALRRRGSVEKGP